MFKQYADSLLTELQFNHFLKVDCLQTIYRPLKRVLSTLVHHVTQRISSVDTMNQTVV